MKLLEILRPLTILKLPSVGVPYDEDYIISDFRLERQIKAAWCWAAVAVAVAKHFNKGSDLSQCLLAESYEVKDTVCCDESWQDNEDFQGGDCDISRSAKLALERAIQRAVIPGGKLTFEDLKIELSATPKRPVVCILKGAGSCHAVVIYGVFMGESGTPRVKVADPWTPENKDGAPSLASFTNNYDIWGRWVTSYRISPVEEASK